MFEVWKFIADTNDHYQVSNYGNVRSVDRVIMDCNGVEYNKRGCDLKPNLLKQLPTVVLRANKARTIHSLVLETFIGPRPEGMWGLHRNENRTDNRVSNLYWGTPSTATTITALRGHSNHIRQIRRSDGKVYRNGVEAAKSVGLKSPSNILKVCKNQEKTSGGYRWEYV